MSQPRIAILLPCCNEGTTIGDVVRDFQAVLPQSEIYVYDNNSKDHTVQEALFAGAHVRHEVIQGKGAVVRRMFSDIDADIYVMCDGDGTYDLKALPIHIQRMTQVSCDMMIGVRHAYHPKAFPRGHAWGNRLLTGLAGFLFQYPLQDLLSGYRIMSRRFVKSLIVQSKGFEVETELTLHAIGLGAGIMHVPTLYGNRPRGSVSKLSTIKDGLKILKTIARTWVQHHPWFSLCPISGACFGVGLWGAFHSDFFSKSTMLFISMAGCMGGIVSLIIGATLWWAYRLTAQLNHLTFNSEANQQRKSLNAA